MSQPSEDLWVPDTPVEGPYADYDREACYNLYRRFYFDDPAVTEDILMRRIRQFVVIIVRSKYFAYDIERKEEMVHMAMMWILRDYVRKKRLPIDRFPKPVACFHSWLFWIIKKAFYIIPHMRKTGLEDFESNDLLDQFVRRVPTADMMELEIFMEDLPTSLYHRCLYRASGRFKDPRLVGALRYVLNRVFKGEPVIEEWLKNHYMVQDHLLFIDYIRVIIRAELSRMAEEIDLVTPTERRNILYEGFRRFTHAEASSS